MRSSSNVCTVHFKRAVKCAALIRADEHTNHARPNGGTVGSAAVGGLIDGNGAAWGNVVIGLVAGAVVGRVDGELSAEHVCWRGRR